MALKTKSIKFNFLMNVILTASSFVFPLITTAYVYRVLGAAYNGSVSVAIGIITTFGMFASLGIPNYGIRACAQVRDNKEELSKTTQELFVLNLLCTGITYIAFFVSLAIIPQFAEKRELLLINSLSLILNAIGVNWFYSALEQYSYITVRSLIVKTISLLLIFLLVQKQEDYLIYTAITVLATGGSNIFNFFHLRKFISMKPVSHLDLKKHIKPVFFFFASAVASSIYTTLDTVLLGFLAGDVQVTYYQTGVKIKNVLIPLVSSLGAVLLPRLSYYIKQGQHKEFKDITLKALNFILILASGVVVYFILFAKEAVLVLGGSKEYLGAVLPMQIVMISVWFIGFSYVTGLQVLIPMGKEKEMLISYAVASVINITSNLILIPHFKAVGTAVSTCLAELSVLIIQYMFLRELLKPLIRKISFGKTFIALIGTVPIVLLVRAQLYKYMVIDIFVLMVTAVVFFLCYGVLLLLLKEPFMKDTVWPTIQSIIRKVTGRRWMKEKE